MLAPQIYCRLGLVRSPIFLALHSQCMHTIHGTADPAQSELACAESCSTGGSPKLLAELLLADELCRPFQMSRFQTGVWKWANTTDGLPKGTWELSFLPAGADEPLFNLHNYPQKDSTVALAILQMEKLRLREVKSPT